MTRLHICTLRNTCMLQALSAGWFALWNDFHCSRASAITEALKGENAYFTNRWLAQKIVQVYLHCVAAHAKKLPLRKDCLTSRDDRHRASSRQNAMHHLSRSWDPVQPMKQVPDQWAIAHHGSGQGIHGPEISPKRRGIAEHLQRNTVSKHSSPKQGIRLRDSETACMA